MKSLIKKHPVTVYFAMTCIISWLGLLPITGIDVFWGKAELSDDLMPLLIMAMCMGPSVTGLILVYLYDGKNGFKALFGRLLIWKVNYKYYLIAILTAPSLTLISALILLFRVNNWYSLGCMAFPAFYKTRPC